MILMSVLLICLSKEYREVLLPWPGRARAQDQSVVFINDGFQLLAVMLGHAEMFQGNHAAAGVEQPENQVFTINRGDGGGSGD